MRRLDTTVLSLLLLLLVVSCEEGAPAAPGTPQVSSVREVCTSWCSPVNLCNTGSLEQTEQCVDDCIAREMFQAPLCTAARQVFYTCQLANVVCMPSDTCVCAPVVDPTCQATCEGLCQCDPDGVCGVSPTDNQFVDTCEARLANVCTTCENEAAAAACQLVGVCKSDEVLTICAACINDEQAYRRCLDTSSCSP
ncbi:MAG: hypothetical protein AAF500_05550 [Myxococcota bacterium]